MYCYTSKFSMRTSIVKQEKYVCNIVKMKKIDHEIV